MFCKTPSVLPMAAALLLSACVSNPSNPSALGNPNTALVENLANTTANTLGAVASSQQAVAGTTPAATSSNAEISEAKLAKIRSGKTRKQELLDLLGAPKLAALGEKGESLLWEYDTPSSKGKLFTALVDKNGIVKTTARPKTPPEVFAKAAAARQNEGRIPGGVIGEALATAVVNKALGGNNADTASSIVSAINGKESSLPLGKNAAPTPAAAGGSTGEALVGALINKAVGGKGGGNIPLTSSGSALNLDAFVPLIKFGKTSKTELIAALGNPVMATPTSKGEELLWQSNQQLLVVSVGKNNLVTSVKRPKSLPQNFANATNNAGDTKSVIAGALVNAVMEKALGAR